MPCPLGGTDVLAGLLVVIFVVILAALAIMLVWGPHVILGALTIMLVWAPLGVFVWFGLPNEVILFKEGYRAFSAILLAAYYGANGALLLQLPRARRKRAVAVAILGGWLFGLWGFFSFVASFQGLTPKAG
jgi:hypothetical protein